MLKIEDSVGIITGGASGIGLEVAKYWVQDGVRSFWGMWLKIHWPGLRRR